jgi:peptidoglycan/LPS O-acetylase OafA/YrhL
MRILALDLIRAVAILLVLGRHAHWPATYGPLTWWSTNGWIGVDIFFVLSGFLVSGLLFKNPSPLTFYYRRGFKIYPSYWALLAITPLVATNILSIQYVNDFFFLQNYTSPIWAHTWSLAVEEHFYLILPLVLLASPKEKLPRLILMICSGVLAIRCLTALKLSTISLPFKTHLRVDGLFFGVLLSYWYHYKPQFKTICIKYKRYLIAASVLLLSPAIFLDQYSIWMYTFGLTSIYLGSGALISVFVCNGVPVNIFTRAIGGMGVFSYSIYLWHPVVLAWILPSIIPLKSWLGVLLYFIISIALGILLAKLIEFPCLKLRDSCLLHSKRSVLPSV